MDFGEAFAQIVNGYYMLIDNYIPDRPPADAIIDQNTSFTSYRYQFHHSSRLFPPFPKIPSTYSVIIAFPLCY